MEIQDTAFEGATKYTAESLSKCHQLADFIRKRQEIEEQYAKALRKLCKSVSLTPLQPPPSSGRRWFWRRRSGNGQAADSPSACSTPLEEVTRTSLWATFYEIIDDTSQVAKSHMAFADSLQHQLLEPLSGSIREMENGRRQLVDQGRRMGRDVQEASSSLKKARKNFDQSNREVVDTRSALERLHGQRQLGQNRDLEKAQARNRTAEERFASARQNFRLQEEALKSLQTKLYSQELPRIITRLQQGEVQRSRDVLSYILALIELERRCAVMNENYASDMAQKLKQINLVEDERRFTRAYVEIPLPPPVATIPSVVAIAPPAVTASRHYHPPSSNVMTQTMVVPLTFPSQPPLAAEMPRTLSMPPAYESQASTTDAPITATAAGLMQRHATGSMVLEAPMPLMPGSAHELSLMPATAPLEFA